MDIEILVNTSDEILFKNIEINSKRDLEWVKQLEATDEHAVIVGGGPSVVDCLDSIRARKRAGQKIFALNNAAKFLFSHGIKPDYQVIVDAREHNVQFVGWAEHFLLASQCDPQCFDNLIPGTCTLWHPVMPDEELNIEDGGREYALIGGGTTVGLSAMCLAYTLGFRSLHLYGYDSSHRGENGHAYAQPENNREPVVKVTAYGQEWDCSLAMAYQAELFPECANNLLELGCSITMDGDGLLPTAFKHLWGQQLTEQEKYEQMWKFDQYRTVAPGEMVADQFVELVAIQAGEKVIDFGCGTGRGAKRIHDLTGAEMFLLDFTSNSIDKDVPIDFFTFIRHDLNNPVPVKAKHGFCTDVMEHIPPEQVDTVIRNVMASAERVFFQISLIEDNCGVLIGQPLHLSVHPFKWWMDKFQSLCFDVFWANDQGDSALFYVAQPQILGE